MRGDERVIVVDCQTAGVSGDMILGALIDLGANVSKVLEAMEAVKGYVKGYESLEAFVYDVTRRGLRAKRVDVKAEGPVGMAGAEFIRAVKDCAKGLGLKEEEERFALNSVHTIVEAEAKVHGGTIDEVHLHEIGSAETVAEIIGTTVALNDLGLFSAKAYSTPVAVGGGLFKSSHGVLASPAPAALEILRSKGFPLIGGPVEAELTTPTGASILVNWAQGVVRFYPLMKPLAVGYGAGAKDFAEAPNVLRVSLGEPFKPLMKDEVIVIETNLDDVTGEVIGRAMERLLEVGAKDVSVIPMFAKKNRPGYIVRVIADRGNVELLASLLMEETGSLGVRMHPCDRFILNREIVEVYVESLREFVKVKVARGCEGEVIQMKPEYEDVKRVAIKLNIPLREVEDIAKMKAREVIKA